MLTKLDNYDYIVLPGHIRIKVSATNDPVLVDILSEIHNSNGRIYVDGDYYLYLDEYDVFTDDVGIYMDLRVVATVRE